MWSTSFCFSMVPTHTSSLRTWGSFIIQTVKWLQGSTPTPGFRGQKILVQVTEKKTPLLGKGPWHPVAAWVQQPKNIPGLQTAAKPFQWRAALVQVCKCMVLAYYFTCSSCHSSSPLQMFHLVWFWVKFEKLSVSVPSSHRVFYHSA